MSPIFFGLFQMNHHQLISHVFCLNPRANDVGHPLHSLFFQPPHNLSRKDSPPFNTQISSPILCSRIYYHQEYWPWSFEHFTIPCKIKCMVYGSEWLYYNWFCIHDREIWRSLLRSMHFLSEFTITFYESSNILTWNWINPWMWIRNKSIHICSIYK